MHPKNLGRNWQVLLFGIAMLVLAAFCFLYPDALADTEAGGRRALIKALVIWLWGWPLGTIALLLGLGAGAASLLPPGKSDEEGAASPPTA